MKQIPLVGGSSARRGSTNCHSTLQGAGPSNADPRVYQEVEDIDKLKLVVNDFLEEHNAESKSPMPLVMFLDAIEHVLRIARILRQPQGNALLLGVGGSGRQSMSKMATYISGYELFQVEIAKGYGAISAF